MFQTGWLLNSVFVNLFYASLFLQPACKILLCNAQLSSRSSSKGSGFSAVKGVAEVTVQEETETVLDILGILRNLKWDSPVFMTPSTNLGKILAVKSFAEQHQVTVISPSPPLLEPSSSTWLMTSPVVLVVIDHRNNLDNNNNKPASEASSSDNNWMNFFNVTLFRREMLNDVLIVCGN